MMTTARKAVIFDFGGVLMKTVDYSPRHRWDAQLGLPSGSVERVVHGSPSWIAAQSGEIATEAYWADVAVQLRLSPDDTARLAHDFYSGDQLDLSLIALIRRLRADGHPVALLSNDVRELADKLVHLGIADLFDPLVISAQIGVMKPNARAYRVVLDRLNVPPEAAIFIDDRMDNIDGARAVGIASLHYAAGMDVAAALAALSAPG